MKRFRVILMLHLSFFYLFFISSCCFKKDNALGQLNIITEINLNNNRNIFKTKDDIILNILFYNDSGKEDVTLTELLPFQHLKILNMDTGYYLPVKKHVLEANRSILLKKKSFIIRQYPLADFFALKIGKYRLDYTDKVMAGDKKLYFEVKKTVTEETLKSFKLKEELRCLKKDENCFKEVLFLVKYFNKEDILIKLVKKRYYRFIPLMIKEGSDLFLIDSNNKTVLDYVYQEYHREKRNVKNNKVLKFLHFYDAKRACELLKRKCE